MTDLPIDVEEGGKVHSNLGPSSMHRWSHCVGSPNLIRKLGDRALKSGMAAAEGSAAHTLLATCLTGGEDAWEHKDEKITHEGFTFTVTNEMIDAVQMAIDWTRAKLARWPSAILLVERRVAAPEDPDAYGTLDIIIIVPNDRLIVGDFKYGSGVVVEPDDEQLRAYGQYSFETFLQMRDIYDYTGAVRPEEGDVLIFPDRHTICELFIIQPRIPHEKGLIRKHITNMNELSRWFFGEVLPAMANTREPDAPLTIGDWCGFCPARDECPALQRGIKEYDLAVEPVQVTDEALNAACVKLKQIVKHGERMQEELFRRAMTGRTFADWKLVRKMANRVWKDGAEPELRTKFGDEAFTKPTLKSPPQIEELGAGAKKWASRWVMKPQTGLTIAPMTDRREAQTSDMDAFDKAEGTTKEPS